MNSPGFLGGGQVGANAQFNRMVVGVEGDFSWMNLSSGSTDSIGEKVNSDVQWTSTATGRVGAAFDRLLVYGKGGLALAQEESSLTDLSGNTASGSFLHTDWTAGAGLIRIHRQLVGKGRIRLSRLRAASDELHHADRIGKPQREPQRA